MGCFGVQILRGKKKKHGEWLNFLLRLSHSHLISCLYLVIFGWLFVSIPAHNPRNQPQTWRLCERSALIPVSPRRVSGSDFSRVFKNEIKFVLIYVSADPSNAEVLLWDLLRFPSDSDQSCEMQSLPNPSGGGGADCDTFPLCEALIWAEAPEQRGWIRVPSPDTDAKRPFTTERPSITNTSGCHPRGHARPNHSGQVVLTGVLLWLEYLCITIRWPVCRELRLTFFTILIPRIKPVILNSLNIIRNIRVKPVSTESKTADLYWTTPGGAK